MEEVAEFVCTVVIEFFGDILQDIVDSVKAGKAHKRREKRKAEIGENAISLPKCKGGRIIE